MADHQTCPACGHAVGITYGPDYRFDPPCTRPRMWTAQCGGDCLDLNLSWTSFTRERALELWNSGVTAAKARARASVAKATGATP